jgi:hypothetical protein
MIKRRRWMLGLLVVAMVVVGALFTIRPARHRFSLKILGQLLVMKWIFRIVTFLYVCLLVVLRLFLSVTSSKA